jgi:phosphodiesterase/alkaline phosphatase D-like protein
MSVSTDITGLKPYATYHYRIVASNSLGTSFGEDATLRTEPPDPPSVNTAESSEVTDTSALISASLNPNLSPTIYRIQYGVSQAYGQQIAVDTSIGEDHVDHAISARLHELKPGTTYHFRIVAANFGGAAQSPDATFTTMAEPSVEAVVAKDITASGATLEALVNPEMSPTVVRFEYGTTAGYGSSTPPLPVGADGLSHAIRAGVGALAAGTSYHYRVVAANAIGTYVSSDQTFTTSSSRSQVGPKPVACRKSRVRRHGKCVKKPSRKRHGHHRPHRGG